MDQEYSLMRSHCCSAWHPITWSCWQKIRNCVGSRQSQTNHIETDRKTLEWLLSPLLCSSEHTRLDIDPPPKALSKWSYRHKSFVFPLPAAYQVFSPQAWLHWATGMASSSMKFAAWDMVPWTGRKWVRIVTISGKVVCRNYCNQTINNND